MLLHNFSDIKSIGKTYFVKFVLLCENTGTTMDETKYSLGRLLILDAIAKILLFLTTFYTKFNCYLNVYFSLHQKRQNSPNLRILPLKFISTYIFPYKKYE